METQETHYKLLKKSMPPIQARFTAFRLEQMNIKSIKSIDQDAELVLRLTTDKGRYKVKYNKVDIPSTTILQIP